MFNNKKIKVLSLILIILGLVSIISYYTLTGYVILNKINKNTGITIGLISLIIGILLWTLSQRDRSGLEEKAEEEISILELLSKKIIPKEFEKDALFLLDTSYIKNNEHFIPNWPINYLRGYKVEIPKRVYEEATKISASKKQPLVKNQSLRYLEKIIGRNNIKEDVQAKRYEDQIYNIWLSTPKGKRSNDYEKDVFRNSGDIKCLSTALVRGRRYTAILGEDSDLFKVANILRKKYNTNVRVYNTSNLRNMLNELLT